LIVSISDSVLAYCVGVNTASATASVSGGTAPYTYEWDDNSVFPQLTVTASNLYAGIYTVTVIDYRGCESVASVDLTSYSAPLSATINSFGPSGIKVIKEFDIPIFLDLKLHDIPATVYKTITTLLTLEPAIINVHASGGKEMMMAAAKALKDSGNKTTKIIAVTILTSLDDDDLCKLGFSEPSKDLVLKLAKLAQESGLDGVVCSAQEISLIRENINNDFMLVVPGIRLKEDNVDDQKRVMTPKEAISLGADLLVIGRPITKAKDQILASKKILEQLK
jgi:orotidine-5'-phosphate decarboxylase